MEDLCPNVLLEKQGNEPLPLSSSILALKQRPRTGWLRACLRKLALLGGPVLANLLYASFACAQQTLQHVDPLVFTALQMALLVPVNLLLLFSTRLWLTRQIVWQGIVAGVLLGGGFLGVALSLCRLGVLSTAMFTSLNGIVASMIAWWALRQRQSPFTLLAGICAGGGALLLWLIAPGAWQTDCLALLAGLLFCGSALYVEQTGLPRGPRERIWPFLSIVLLTMAVFTLLCALCFGSWSSVLSFSPGDLAILAYTSVATVLLPIVIVTLLQRALSAVTLSFLAVLEPLTSIGFACWQGTSSIGFPGWFGVGLILLSMLCQVGAATRCATNPAEKETNSPKVLSTTSLRGIER